MTLHGLPGGHGILHPDGSDDAWKIAEDDLRRGRIHVAPEAHEDGDGRALDTDKEWICRAFGEPTMEIEVELHCAARIRWHPVRRDHLLQAAERLRRPALGRDLGGEELDSLPDFPEVLKREDVDDQGKREALGNICLQMVERQVGDAITALTTTLHLEDSRRYELAERVPDGGPAHAEQPRKVEFGREGVSRLQGPLEDLLLDGGRDLLGRREDPRPHAREGCADLIEHRNGLVMNRLPRE